MSSSLLCFQGFGNYRYLCGGNRSFNLGRWGTGNKLYAGRYKL